MRTPHDIRVSGGIDSETGAGEYGTADQGRPDIEVVEAQLNIGVRIIVREGVAVRRGVVAAGVRCPDAAVLDPDHRPPLRIPGLVSEATPVQVVVVARTRIGPLVYQQLATGKQRQHSLVADPGARRIGDARAGHRLHEERCRYDGGNAGRHRAEPLEPLIHFYSVPSCAPSPA